MRVHGKDFVFICLLYDMCSVEKSKKVFNAV